MTNYFIDLNKLKELEDKFKDNPITLENLKENVNNFKKYYDTFKSPSSYNETLSIMSVNTLLDLKILKEVKEENKVQQLNS